MGRSRPVRAEFAKSGEYFLSLIRLPRAGQSSAEVDQNLGVARSEFGRLAQVRNGFGGMF